MNTGHRWTKDEDEAALEMTWEEFNERYNKGVEQGDPEYISWHAFRQRKGHLKRQERMREAAAEASVRRNEPQTLQSDSCDYVGFTIGFFDLETTYSNEPRVMYAAIVDEHNRLYEFDRYQYPGENPLLDDFELVNALVDRLEEFDIVMSWNGAGFDIPVINARLAVKHSKRRYLPRMHKDLMYETGYGKLRIGKRSLEHVGDVFGAETEKTKVLVPVWDAATVGDRDAYEYVRDHCIKDVRRLREVFADLKHGIRRIGG